MAVLQGLDGLDFLELSILLSKSFEGPVGADGKNVGGFWQAFFSPVDHDASSVGFDLPLASSREGLRFDDEPGFSRGLFHCETGFRGVVVLLQRVVVRGEPSLVMDRVGVDVRLVEDVAVPDSEGHSLLVGDLSEGEWVDISNDPPDTVQRIADEGFAGVQIGVVGAVDVVGEGIPFWVASGLLLCH